MRLLFPVLICGILCGCRDEAAPDEQSQRTASQRAAVKLSVFVVDDPELAQGIKLLGGEWNERSGGELAVVEGSLDELLAAEKPPADVVIYPSRQLGELVMRGWLRPVRQSVLDDAALAWGDFLTAIRDQIVRYGGEVYALPLGDMPLVVAWQGKVPERLPSRWEQLSEQGVGLGSAGMSPYPLTGEFLARALALTSPADRATLLFDPQTMDAQLTGPSSSRALEWLVSAQRPTEGATASVTLPRGVEATVIGPLLAADELFTPSLERWDKAELERPPVILGFAGRLVSVAATSRNAASAFKLVPWLTSGATGAKLSQRSKATLWCRVSQVSQAADWFPAKADDSHARLVTAELSRGDAYVLPRVPGIEQYLMELEAVLRRAVAGEQSVQQALADAADRWNKLTDSHGRDEQRAAFGRHLGLAE